MPAAARPLQRPSQRGLTLVELLIALTLGLIVVGALVAIFVSSNRSYQQNDALVAIQDNARFALDAISRDLAMAGYWGGVRPTDASLNIRVSADGRDDVPKATADGDCGPAAQDANTFWLFDVGVPIVFRNHLATTNLSGDFTCLSATNVQPMTDVLMIRRVSGESALTSDGATTVGATETGRYYVKTSQNIGSLYRASGSFNLGGPTDCPDSGGISEACPPTSAPVQVYAYTPQLYYIRNFLRTAGDGLPVLCRRYLNDSDTAQPLPAMVEDCLAEGVENLQIEWGLDTGSGLQYTFTPTPQQLLMARTARVHLLVRSTSKNVAGSDDAKTFSLADLTDFTPAAPGVLRRAFTTTVQLKNIRP